MRIAYITPYQGPTLLKRRPIVRNRSMSNRIKIELIASLLRSASHDVEIISQGEVVEHSCTFYPSFSEPERFDPHIPIYYGSVLPIRRLNGFWSTVRTLHIFKERHKARPYDLVIVFNMKGPEIACANYAIGRFGLPVILEYEDDMFVNVKGEKLDGMADRRSARAAARLLTSVSGCIGVSPYLLAQAPPTIPSLLLRGVVGDDILKASEQWRARKERVVLFSGTHVPSNGVGELIRAWREVQMPDWQLHITGYGRLTEELRQLAAQVRGVVFHGLVSRSELVRLMCSATICINPHVVSQTPGNVFAFKLIEYLACGAHVITTPMGPLEQELEAGITYMPDNSPQTIARTIREVINRRSYDRIAMEAAQLRYGPTAVAKSLSALLGRVRNEAVTKPQVASASLPSVVARSRNGSFCQ
jgi:glycosyltransferase involved in cell wall biosynthesis